MINIHTGKNQILEQCRPLQDYSIFVETFRRYRERDGISDRMAAGRAIADLPQGDVRDYLRAHEAEVVDMLLTEYDEEKTLQAEYYAGEQAGIQRERERGLQRLYEHAAKKTLPVAAAVEMAADYGIVDEADFRKRAAAQGIQLPETRS